VVETVRAATDRVLTYGYHIFDAERFDGIDAVFARTKSFTTALTEFGIPAFYRRSTWIDCRMPRLIEADTLGIALDEPVIVMSYVDADAEGAAILLAHAVLPSGTLRVRIDTP